MFRKYFMTVFVCMVCFLGLVTTSRAASRTALVIGNAHYPIAPLLNPANDARDIAKALEGLGFEVICKVDADRREMDEAVEQFYLNLKRANVGFFYYAGHGMQINGKNYLLPVDIQVKSSADIKYRATRTDWILSKMEDSGSKVNVIVLDACRNNPFRGFRGVGDGLAPIQSVRGSFIAYATAPGSVARDGRGRNGIYTSHLLRSIKKPGLTVEEVFREVRKGVAESTNYEQIPWDSSSLMGAFYIADVTSGRSDNSSHKERHRFEQQKPVEVASLPKTSYSKPPEPPKKDHYVVLFGNTDEINRKKIRATGYWFDYVKDNGGTRVLLPVGEIVPALERGIIDGAILSTTAYNLYDIKDRFPIRKKIYLPKGSHMYYLVGNTKKIEGNTIAAYSRVKSHEDIIRKYGGKYVSFRSWKKAKEDLGYGELDGVIVEFGSKDKLKEYLEAKYVTPVE